MTSSIIKIAIAIIGMAIVAYAMFLIFKKVEVDVAATGAKQITAVVPAIAIFFKGRKKGMELTTSLVATIVLVLAVTLMLFLLFASFAYDAGSSTVNFFYSIFDAIVRALPL